jgi:hypothetical protein
MDAEASVPCVLFNVEGVFSNEQVPNRPQPILADLRRDAKEDRLHRVIEKVMMLTPEPKKAVSKPTKKVHAILPAIKGRERAPFSARR